ncbi:MAG: hypothetical protein KTR24_03190 [Saprospiraceae bacterium]|nr:hypothetical protein [Saprospiraceae bacterium]
MLEFFRKNLFVYNALLLGYCLLLRLGGWFRPQTNGEEAHLLADFFMAISGPADSWGGILLSFFIIMLTAIQINRLVSLNRLTPTNSLFPGLFFILISSYTLSLQSLSPAVIGNLFVVTMLLEIFKQTRNEELLIRTFNVGFLAGIASLSYSPYLILLPLGIIGMIVVRTFKRLDYFRCLLGFISPYLLAISILILFDQPGAIWSGHFKNTFAWMDLSHAFSWSDYVVISLFIIGILLAVLNMSNMTMKTNIHARRKLTTLYIFLLTFVLVIPFVAETGTHRVHLATIPLSVFIGSMMLRIDKQTAEVIHFILLAGAIVFQYLVV